MLLNLACTAFGNSNDHAPLVILHGLFGSSRNWRRIAQTLAEHRRVYALDQRNHGDSPWSADMSYQALAGDILAFLDDHGIDRATVMGHSMGGKTAMTLALTRPERVRALIVVDIAPVDYAHSFNTYIDAMRNAELTPETRRGDVDRALTDAIPEAAVRAFLLQNLQVGGGTPEWRINLAALADQMPVITGFPADLSERRYDGPCLFLAGGLSAYVRGDSEPTIRALFPSAQIARIPEAGHWVHAESPDAFLHHVNAFLDDTGA